MFSEQEKIHIREIAATYDGENRITMMKNYLQTLPQLSENGIEWSYLATQICRQYGSKTDKDRR